MGRKDHLNFDSGISCGTVRKPKNHPRMRAVLRSTDLIASALTLVRLLLGLLVVATVASVV